MSDFPRSMGHTWRPIGERQWYDTGLRFRDLPLGVYCWPEEAKRYLPAIPESLLQRKKLVEDYPELGLPGNPERHIT